jgi:hypothetical protein
VRQLAIVLTGNVYKVPKTIAKTFPLKDHILFPRSTSSRVSLYITALLLVAVLHSDDDYRFSDVDGRFSEG